MGWNVPTVFQEGAIPRGLAMSEPTRGKGVDSSALAAVRWLFRFEHKEAETLSDEDLRKWAGWVAEPANLRLYQLAQRLWRSLSIVADDVDRTRGR